MNIDHAFNIVRDKFVYRADDLPLFDSWSIMIEKEGKFYGDCEDFTLTVIWFACDCSLWKFFLNVFILHKYKIWFSLTKDGVKHNVGSYKGLYFDNWVNGVFDKETFVAKTKHRLIFFHISLYFWLFFLIGFIRTRVLK